MFICSFSGRWISGDGLPRPLKLQSMAAGLWCSRTVDASREHSWVGGGDPVDRGAEGRAYDAEGTERTVRSKSQ